MPNGTLREYIAAHSDADILGLVGDHFIVSARCLLPITAIRRRRGTPLSSFMQRGS